MKTLLYVSLFCAAAGSMTAQNGKTFLDTLDIDCNDQVSVKIAVADHLWLKSDTTLAGIISELQENLGRVRQNIPEGNYTIVYRPGASLVIESLAPVSKYMLAGDSVKRILKINRCEIPAEGFHAEFTFGDLGGMLDAGLIQCIIGGIRLLPDESRYARTYHFRYADGVAREVIPPSKNGYAWDMMNLSAGIGTGLVKSELVTDIGLEIGFNFNKKGFLRNGYYISNNLVYLFDGPTDRFSLNNFVNLGYRYNFSKDTEKTRWIGPEIGFPVYREGEFFKNTLFRLGIRWELAKSIYVTGQMYVNEKFKTAYPALRIGFWF